jgi:hypothetical protein
MDQEQVWRFESAFLRSDTFELHFSISLTLKVPKEEWVDGSRMTKSRIADLQLHRVPTWVVAL